MFKSRSERIAIGKHFCCNNTVKLHIKRDKLIQTHFLISVYL